jgi:hypothetical protein
MAGGLVGTAEDEVRGMAVLGKLLFQSIQLQLQVTRQKK